MPTLAELRAELSARLGFSAMATPPGMVTLLNSFLATAQSEIYLSYDHRNLQRYWDLPTVVGQTLYALPTNAAQETPDPDHIQSLHVIISNAWAPLAEGIAPELYTLDSAQYPNRYAIRDQLEIWPTPDAVYTLKIYGTLALQPFAADDDTATIDDRLILLHALMEAKAHYGQPDAKIYETRWRVAAGRLRARNHGNVRYVPGGHKPAPMVRPKLV